MRFHNDTSPSIFELVTFLISLQGSIIKEQLHFIIAFYPYHNTFWNSNSESTNIYDAKREERKPTRCNNIDGLLSIMDVGYWQCLNMFRASLCPSSGVKTTCYCIWSVFAGNVGCGRLRCCGATLRVWSLWRFLFPILLIQTCFTEFYKVHID